MNNKLYERAQKVIELAKALEALIGCTDEDVSVMFGISKEKAVRNTLEAIDQAI